MGRKKGGKFQAERASKKLEKSLSRVLIVNGR